MSKKNKKAMEQAPQPEVVEQDPAIAALEAEAYVPRRMRPEPAKVQFDAWWAARSAAIPAIHKKEIIKADMMGRKVPMVASMAEFDEALKKYGVELA